MYKCIHSGIPYQEVSLCYHNTTEYSIIPNKELAVYVCQEHLISIILKCHMHNMLVDCCGVVAAGIITPLTYNSVYVLSLYSNVMTTQQLFELDLT